MARLIVVLVLLIGIAACDDPRCPADQVPKATESYGACLQMEQQGDGGLSCGRRAYDTFCRMQK